MLRSDALLFLFRYRSMRVLAKPRGEALGQLWKYFGMRVPVLYFLNIVSLQPQSSIRYAYHLDFLLMISKD
jgi:hypothetical protein